MTLKMETPARLADATGANIETASFLKAVYADQDAAATPFKHVSTVALRIAHLANSHGLTAERAAMLAPLIFEGGRV